MSGATEPIAKLASAQLAETIRAADWSHGRAMVIGYGPMGKLHVDALRALGVLRIRVCSRPGPSMDALRDAPDIEPVAEDVDALSMTAEPDELAILALPIALLARATERMIERGFRRIIVEKPAALRADAIERLAERCDRAGVEAWCGYNRTAYPAVIELAARAADEGGITSCAYDFTEMVKPDWPRRFDAETLARWAIANSLHPISLAHALIGQPAQWHAHRRGWIEWHPTGSVFVGSGLSEQGIPFSYHANWGSKGRWLVECHTPQSAYRLCPIERLWRKTAATGEWEEVSVATVAPSVKAGLLEQAAAALMPELRACVRLVSLHEAAALTRYVEDICGYAAAESR